MMKLLRSKNMIKMGNRGGGHGWTRPDPPTTEIYVHRREVYNMNIRIQFSI